MSSVLNYLKLKPSLQSVDYVENKKQFHLYSLLTEQRHPKTWSLSSSIAENTPEGLRMLLSVDEDIVRKVKQLSLNTLYLEQASDAIYRAIRNGKKIYFYGCGSTGRLAKQMESSFWRPFWRGIKTSELWGKLNGKFPENIEDYLIGEMTGADRALISSLEGFEDLLLIGRLQHNDRGIEKGDVVFCVTEGGETSSVIGTIIEALNQYGEMTAEAAEEAARNLYFVYNNPDDLLMPFDRSRTVLENPFITKINLTTGPQSITGSTRMQATTSEIFVLGCVLEEALFKLIKESLDSSELEKIGFRQNTGLKERLESFSEVKYAVDKTISVLSALTDAESETYAKGRFTTYFACDALVTVFVDSTERSPTFRLFPLDTIRDEKRKSWIQVWTEGNNLNEAWHNFLGRDFVGLEKSFYQPAFENEIEDSYLKEVALKSLENAGYDQKDLYDLSFSDWNVKNRGPGKGDLGIVVCIDDEIDMFNNRQSSFRRFAELFRERGGSVGVLKVRMDDKHLTLNDFNADIDIDITLPGCPDPITLRKQIALKMLLNAHSTGIMAKLGRVIGNTMTSLNPSNLKLIGRATYLIMSHVNDTIVQKEWIDRYGESNLLTFEEVNAVLFDSIDYMNLKGPGQTAEVALSIIRLLEALKRKDNVGWEEVQDIHDRQGLEGYLLEHNPSLSASGK